MFWVHIQVTFAACSCRNTVTTCRQAATQVAGDVCPYPHWYHFALLAALKGFGPASQIALGQRCGIDRSDTHAMLTELADQGLVTRAPDPADKRRNVITMTPAGARRLEELDAALAVVQDDLFRLLSPRNANSSPIS